jgi:hypothetical protein
MAPHSAAGKHLVLFPRPTSGWSRLLGGLVAGRVGWWWLAKQVEADMVHGSLENDLEPDTARCTNCGHELQFGQSPD